ncbi:nitrous oxide reductase family maturation protein NosD [Virgibacillus sp. MSP4-1]|uniref:nitrous oxide reductase family maturation protein NosD n=1 Tax=Virgibacillus sp. MSP4-1 TaxID=2700081 RepID=UPI0003AA1086|nr:nitrous oxide reductase family maturation protein NosD [Virgibacillus sp. MSP4-1]QHS24170.1 nitrous oxide reductase family maturation protein NosD [Virgibacillus sp. MSP4-1]
MSKQWKIIKFLFTTLLFLHPVHSQADTTSINELIQHAESGDTIKLNNHVYHEDVVIDKPVTIIGKRNTVIEGTGKGNVVTFRHDGITLKQVTIRNSSPILNKDYAAIKVYSDDNKILNTKIEDSLHGIYLSENKGNVLAGNTIIGDQDLNQSRRGNGIHLFYSSENLIKNNVIDGARDGIYFSFANQNRITQNRMTNHRYGLHYMYSDHNEFYQNEFYQNTGGAAVMYSDSITLKENKFYDHHGLQSFGLLLQTANDVKVIDNTMVFNQKGIFMDQSNRNLLKNNLIANNQIGLDIWNSSMDNQFTGNEIIQNKLQYTKNGAEDRNKWSVDGVGNAWSDYTFIDLNQDSVGDQPYTYQSAFSEVIAKEQLGILFLDSPALQLYETSTQLFAREDGAFTDPSPIHSSTQKGRQSVYFIILMLVTSGGLLWLIQRNWKTN